jgi:hypothetical protein
MVFVNPGATAIRWHYDLLVVIGARPSFSIAQALGGAPINNLYCNAAQAAPARGANGTVVVASHGSATVALTWPICNGALAPPPSGIYTLVMIADSLTGELTSLDSQTVDVG